MKLRFEVDRTEAFRRGVDVPKSIVTIEVRASKVTQEQRNLIADRLDGVDVLKLHYDPKTCKPQRTYYLSGPDTTVGKPEPVRIQANLPTFEAMMEAIEANQAEIARTDEQPHKTTLKINDTSKPNMQLRGV